ncbi:MAG: aldo/keto reductase [Paludibacter sp.]|nr:aldo/keto reductase [Paludibacter sp.]
MKKLVTSFLALLLGVVVTQSYAQTYTLNIVKSSGTMAQNLNSSSELLYPLGNFDHQVTQPAPGGNTSDGGPQAVSNIISVSGVPLVRLNNGVLMPRFGLGTQVQSMEGANQRQQLNETARGMVISALKSGYRHLDDAMFYYNERGIGWGIRESGIPREEIWLTSKISGNLANAQNAFDGMLQRLQVDYIDLVYIHHPAGTLSDILACWRVMEKEYKAGRIRALGISNFDNRMDAFNYIMQNAEIKPQVAQIECHPLAQRKEARQLYANNYDIQVECWYPLNHNRDNVVRNALLQQIATAHGKSVYQIILRWHMQEGLCPVPGATNPAHILENISIIDFELSDEEMSAIRAIDLGNAGRSFNISYGNSNFGNFQDYTYNHTYTPNAIESVLTDTNNRECQIFYSGNQLIINNLPNGRHNFSVYSVVGVLVHSSVVDSGSPTVNMNNIGKGAYIAFVNNQAIKFVKQ